MGSFALQSAASRGIDVIGIDQFAPPHDKGSSHGETRLIREAYSEDAAYIPLLQRSMELWREHAKNMSGDVFFETGVQYIGPEQNDRVVATRKSAAQYDLPLIEYPRDDTPFIVPKGWTHFYETRAGYLNVENVLAELITRAKADGATVSTGTRISSITRDQESWKISAGNTVISAERVIFSLGPWSHDVLSFLRPVLELERHTLHWLRADPSKFSYDAGFRPFTVHKPNGDWFYGFPVNKEGLVKISEHNSGERFKTWDQMDRDINEIDIHNITQFCNDFLPDIGPIEKSVSCMYTMTPDHNFIIDRHPDHFKSALAAGLSGHGYKFAPVIGDILVDLSLGNDPGFDLSLFSLSRFANV